MHPVGATLESTCPRRPVTLVAVWGKILKLERGHGSSTCNMRKDCNMSFDTTPFVKMIRGVDSSVCLQRDPLKVMSRSDFASYLLAVLFIGSVRVQQSTESQQFLSNYLPSLQSSEWVTNKERCVIESRLSVWTVENIYHTICKKINFMKAGQFSSQCISISLYLTHITLSYFQVKIQQMIL